MPTSEPTHRVTGKQGFDLDRRKARIITRLYPTRVGRGFKTSEQAEQAAAQMGTVFSTLRKWENGDVLPSDEQVPVIEAWLSEGPVWRYDRIDHIVGPEKWIPRIMDADPAPKVKPDAVTGEMTPKATKGAA